MPNYQITYCTNSKEYGYNENKLLIPSWDELNAIEIFHANKPDAYIIEVRVVESDE